MHVLCVSLCVLEGEYSYVLLGFFKFFSFLTYDEGVNENHRRGSYPMQPVAQPGTLAAFIRSRSRCCRLTPTTAVFYFSVVLFDSKRLLTPHDQHPRRVHGTRLVWVCKPDMIQPTVIGTRFHWIILTFICHNRTVTGIFLALNGSCVGSTVPLFSVDSE